MIMKKFYISLFTAVLLVSSLVSQGQVYTSIITNPSHWTLDDPRFWGAVLPADIVNPAFCPQNPCNNCTINIQSDVVIVPQNGAIAQNGGVGTTSLVPGANDISLSHLVLNGGSINVIGNTSVTVNTWVELHGVTLLLGSNATDVGSFFVNDEITMDQASSVRLANTHGYIDANNAIGTKTNMFGTINNLSSGDPQPGIYANLTAPIGGVSYSQTLTGLGNGSGAASFAYYGSAAPFTPFNCTNGVGLCTFGIVNGPATTNFNATYGVVFGVTPVLPVQLVQFIADKNDDGSIKLSWSTAQEQNSSHFEIERSGDQAKWISLGSVKAKGYSSTTSNYTFTDKEPIDGKGYYRLKMVDLDQKFQYSPTVVVSSTSTNNQALIIYNNPYSDMIRTRVHLSRAQNLVLTVSDMVGRTYINQNYPAQAGNNYINLQPNIGSSGMYILRIHGDSYDQTVKIEKQ